MWVDQGVWRLQKDEKVRVYALARELDMESTDMIELCHQAGFKVKNQLSSLDADQRVMIEKLARSGVGRKDGPAKGATAPVLPASLPTPVPTLVAKPQVHAPAAVVAAAVIAAPPPHSPPAPATPVAPKIPELGNKMRNLAPPPKPRPAPAPPGGE